MREPWNPRPLERSALQLLARRRAIWAAVLVVALVVRLAAVLTAPPQLLWTDGRDYERIGWVLASEGRYTGIALLPPGYPMFIAGVYAVFGRHLLVLRLAEALLSTVTVGFVGAFGAALFSPAAGLVAAVLAAFHPVMVILPLTCYVENLLLLVGTLAFGCFALAVKRPSSARWLLAGATYGAALMVKPVMMTLLPGFALGAFLTLRRFGARPLVWGGVFALALTLVIAPWIIRNHRVHDRWFFVASGGGRQFWFGNNLAATASTQRNPEPTGAFRESLERVSNEADAERLYYREGWRFIREHPARSAWLYLLKARNLWALHPQTQTRTVYSTRAADWAQGATSVVVFVGAALGLARLRTCRMWALPLGALSFTLMASFYLTVMRHRMAFEVILLWLAGLGWAGLLGRRDAGTPASLVLRPGDSIPAPR